ncbi:TB2/DP1/HVA22-related protein [Niveomyces insectorum RCEF 264]|uniref:TB2/DP1/HVA22-related protein n=1 Tax=Niveomyces insectorum RCEF 264 TaxID=1081102 RepID=A0A167M1R5_9HYPO|nr:TB2/DP1/HVA22-related protein [Niveomyces insectorum RCEF 264]
MFDIIPLALASVVSFLFPVFASYKALNSADPAQLTPWLMYWVVLSCALLVESWTAWLLVWVPFYAYLRLAALLYLVLPQTQGARVIYQTHVHPWLARHEARIDDGIAAAHTRLRAAGWAYLQQAVAYVRTLLGLPVSENAAAAGAAQTTRPGTAPSPSSQSYTQALLARFSLPGARWPGGAAGASAAGSGHAGSTTTTTAPSNTTYTSGADLYGMLTSAVNALGTATGGAAGAAGAAASAFVSSSSSSSTTRSAGGTDPTSFVDVRDRLRALMAVLEGQATRLEKEAGHTGDQKEPDETHDDNAAATPLSRPSSGGSSSAGGLSKSRSEADFETIDAESGTEEAGPRRRRRRGGPQPPQPSGGAAGGSESDAGSGTTPGAAQSGSGGSWMPWGWRASPSAGGTTPAGGETSTSSGTEK